MQSGVYEFLAQDRVIYGRPAADAVAEGSRTACGRSA